MSPSTSISNPNDWKTSVRNSWRPYAILFVVTLAIFGRTIGFDYTNFDDDVLILKAVQSTSFLTSVAEAFRTPYLTIYYRPIVSLSFLLDGQISDVNPWMYHFSGVVIHFSCACALFHLLVLLSVQRANAFIAAIIFCIHPIVTQSVVWIPGRNDSMLALFILVSTSLLVNASTRGRRSEEHTSELQSR